MMDIILNVRTRAFIYRGIFFIVIIPLLQASETWSEDESLLLSGAVKHESHPFAFQVYFLPPHYLLGKKIDESCCNILYLNDDKLYKTEWFRIGVQRKRLHGQLLKIYTDLGIFTFGPHRKGSFKNTDITNETLFEYMKQTLRTLF